MIDMNEAVEVVRIALSGRGFEAEPGWFVQEAPGHWVVETDLFLRWAVDKETGSLKLLSGRT